MSYNNPDVVDEDDGEGEGLSFPVVIAHFKGGKYHIEAIAHSSGFNGSKTVMDDFWPERFLVLQTNYRAPKKRD